MVQMVKGGLHLTNENYSKVEDLLKRNKETYKKIEYGFAIYPHTIFFIQKDEIVVSFNASLNSSYVAIKAIEYKEEFGDVLFIGEDFYYSYRTKELYHGEKALEMVAMDIIENSIETYQNEVEMQDFLVNWSNSSKYTN